MPSCGGERSPEPVKECDRATVQKSLYEKAAQRGSNTAPFYLGEIILKEGNSKAAIWWFNMAFKRGNLDAGMQLASTLENDPHAKDLARAFNIYEELAVCSSKEISDAAAIKLGDAYQYGNGVKKSMSDARYWYKSVVDSGEAITKWALKKLDQDAQILASEVQLSRQWFPVDTAKPSAIYEPRLKIIEQHTLQKDPDNPRPVPSVLRKMLPSQLELLTADENHHAQFLMGLNYEAGSGGFQKT